MKLDALLAGGAGELLRLKDARRLAAASSLPCISARRSLGRRTALPRSPRVQTSSTESHEWKEAQREG